MLTILHLCQWKLRSCIMFLSICWCSMWQLSLCIFEKWNRIEIMFKHFRSTKSLINNFNTSLFQISTILKRIHWFSCSSLIDLKMNMIPTKSPHSCSTISYRSDFLTYWNWLPFLYRDSIHVPISSKIEYPIIDKLNLHNISISSLRTSIIDLSICNRVQWSPLSRGNIYSIMTSLINSPSTQIISTKKHRINISIELIASIFLIISILNQW